MIRKDSNGMWVGWEKVLLRRGLAIALIGALALAAVPSQAAPPATYDWEFSCTNIVYIGWASWVWLQDGAAINGSSGAAECYDASVQNATVDRPAGANGIAVTLGLATCKDTEQTKTVTKSFSVDKPFKLKVTDFDRCSGGFTQRVALSIVA